MKKWNIALVERKRHHRNCYGKKDTIFLFVFQTAWFINKTQHKTCNTRITLCMHMLEFTNYTHDLFKEFFNWTNSHTYAKYFQKKFVNSKITNLALNKGHSKNNRPQVKEFKINGLNSRRMHIFFWKFIFLLYSSLTRSLKFFILRQFILYSLNRKHSLDYKIWNTHMHKQTIRISFQFDDYDF